MIQIVPGWLYFLFHILFILTAVTRFSEHKQEQENKWNTMKSNALLITEKSIQQRREMQLTSSINKKLFRDRIKSEKSWHKARVKPTINHRRNNNEKQASTSIKISHTLFLRYFKVFERSSTCISLTKITHFTAFLQQLAQSKIIILWLGKLT